MNKNEKNKDDTPQYEISEQEMKEIKILFDDLEKYKEKLAGGSFLEAVNNEKKRREGKWDSCIFSIDLATPSGFKKHLPKGMVLPWGLMNEELIMAEKFAIKKDLNIMINGETGTGKSAITQFIHNKCHPKNKTKLLTCNVATLADVNITHSILFGHIKGAYTGALNDRIGLIEEAKKGTVFLDEIDKLDISLQGSLLYLLDNGKFRKFGSDKEQKAECRFIFATNVDLKKKCEEGKFLWDLYWRIHYPVITIPPFRDWPKSDDLLSEVLYKLVPQSIIQQLSTSKEDERCDEEKYENYMMYLSDTIRNQTKDLKLWDTYTWPGNFREFIQYVRVALITNDWIGYFSENQLTPTTVIEKLSQFFEDEIDSLPMFDDIKTLYLEKLISSGKLQNEIIKISGLSRSTVQRKYKQHKNMH
ncbi:MAG: sigma 54-interacting transcriptional regulator [Fibrobacteria bacterium]|nr:sigma 54-interacting transcriptional regulator [Fibrobacteria bacterium]